MLNIRMNYQAHRMGCRKSDLVYRRAASEHGIHTPGARARASARAGKEPRRRSKKVKGSLYCNSGLQWVSSGSE
jgi:hypothetical protein